MEDLIKEYKRLIRDYLDQGYEFCDAQEKSGAKIAEKHGLEVYCFLPWFIEFEY